MANKPFINTFKTIAYIIVSALMLCSCSFQKIETGKTLDNSTIELIRSIGLLDKKENVIKYYSNFQQNKAGNFFTNKRIAHYWLEENHPDEKETTFAFYKDIIAIDTIYQVPDTFCPYMEITKADSTKFKVFVDGSKSEIRAFYEEAMKVWAEKK